MCTLLEDGLFEGWEKDRDFGIGGGDGAQVAPEDAQGGGEREEEGDEADCLRELVWGLLWLY